MAGAIRLIGQSTTVAVIIAGQVVSTSFAVKSNNLSFQNEILTEGYLGETTNRRDSVFNGVTGSMDVHISDAAAFSFVTSVVNANRARTAGLSVTIKHTYQFSNGQRVITTLPGVAFGEIPFANGGRTEYVTVSIPYEVDTAAVQVA